jgi:hypothetical protein
LELRRLYRQIAGDFYVDSPCFQALNYKERLGFQPLGNGFIATQIFRMLYNPHHIIAAQSQNILGIACALKV